MASFLILVHSGRYAEQSSRSALCFAKAALAQGHTIQAVFFYQQGVTHANRLSCIPTDELDTANGFKRLKNEHRIPLLVCVTAAEKRGIVDDQQAHQESLGQGNADEDFTIAGLAEMAALAAQTDRVLQFK